MDTELFQHSEVSTASARISPCECYRYELWRRWGTGPYVMFIGLNPSTANATQDDPTIRRCIAFAKGWGYSALCMSNLFAFRATDPAVMKKAEDPVGPENDATLLQLAADADVVVAAWGNDGSHMDRAKQVLALIPNVHALRITDAKQPSHPLYLPKHLTPVPYSSMT